MHITLHNLWQQFRQMSLLEVVAAITSLISIVLMVRNNIWTWLWSIVSVILYGVVFYQSKAYANAGLQIFYFLPISFYAWWIWLRGGPKRDNDLPVTRLSSRVLLAWVGVTVLLSVVIVWTMLRFLDDPNPYADGITTAMSIVAQYIQARKQIENWPIWIVADVIYTFYLFPVQHLYATTLLYAITLVLAFIGWAEWRRIMQAQQVELYLPPNDAAPNKRDV